MSYLNSNQPTCQFFLLPTQRSASMAHLLSGGALAGRLRMTTWRERGSSPLQGGGLTLRQGLNSAAFTKHPFGGSRYFMKPNNFQKKRHQIKHQINQNQRIFETFDLCSFPTKSCRLFRKSPQKIVGGVFLPEDPLN